jgi:hypothetical protein
MPTKRTTPVATIPLVPALKFLLMAGAPAQARVPGWVSLAQGGDDDAVLREAWNQHGVALTAEALAHDFAPSGLRSRPPSGTGFRRWRDTFLAEHRY